MNLGAKGQEPLQLGIRTALEEATMQLVGAVSRRDPSSCIAQSTAVTRPAAASTASHG
ncbi:hypothetical protein U1839_16250 [Sphingomonas sp. RT2P30]|uniref:hypothetical protein n=1 Tax=Parasphingomonas halimpatiens TaxID=3096162 RepID=UPI002FC8FBE4